MQIYHSPRCWKTRTKAKRDFKQLTSEAQQKKAVQEQILMRLQGCNMDEAYTPSANKSAQELFDFFLEDVLPLA